MAENRILVRQLSASEIRSHINQIAALRIEVFRQWPYLYDGDLVYERDYLKTYVEAPNAFLAGAFDGDKLVGASTAMPLSEHEKAFSEPLAKAGFSVENFFYFGESVLIETYRGVGVGVRFFQLREAEARKRGFPKCVFAAVERANDHSLKPDHYRELDQFWQNRGYEKLASPKTFYNWKDVGQTEETVKAMRYWCKTLQ